jgi:hypothetical protein
MAACYLDVGGFVSVLTVSIQPFRKRTWTGISTGGQRGTDQTRPGGGVGGGAWLWMLPPALLDCSSAPLRDLPTPATLLPRLFCFVGGAADGRTHSGSRQRRVGGETIQMCTNVQPLENLPVHISMFD